ncbi:MAG: helix-turn-helix transcriptional regulator [Clostridia bacterium]|nr:helix-turn-helix transcriptional regulator [Clostridia bacterium]
MIEFDNGAVGIVIRNLRKSKKMSQEVLSGLTGLARSHLSMIENGEKHPNLETVWRIANTLEISPHELVEEIEKYIESNK